jgi:hypothetical protein
MFITGSYIIELNKVQVSTASCNLWGNLGVWKTNFPDTTWSRKYYFELNNTIRKTIEECTIFIVKVTTFHCWWGKKCFGISFVFVIYSFKFFHMFECIILELYKVKLWKVFSRCSDRQIKLSTMLSSRILKICWCCLQISCTRIILRAMLPKSARLYFSDNCKGGHAVINPLRALLHCVSLP